MVRAPVLALPNATDPFILDTDASDKSVGAELIQIQEGEERTVALCSFCKCNMLCSVCRCNLLCFVCKCSLLFSICKCNLL